MRGAGCVIRVEGPTAGLPDKPLLADDPQAGALVELDEALEQLARLGQRQSRVVELRFRGFKVQEASPKFLEVS
jgi:ECF sigma factor